MNLGRGDDNFKSLVSYSTPALGRKLYAEKNYSSDHKWNGLEYNNGDLNTSIIKTSMGRTIMVHVGDINSDGVGAPPRYFYGHD